MTCAGLIGLAVGRGVEMAGAQKADARDFGKDPQVQKALLYLGGRIGGLGNLPAVAKGKGKGMAFSQGMTIHADAWGDYYFLWSLERAAVVLGLQTIGGKDWYGWGSEILVRNQAENGGWNDSFPGSVD